MEDCCWERLGIDPTADTTAIKKAYAKQLKFNKPDKNPEGFRGLRAAYEQALEESYWYEEEEEEDFIESGFIESDFIEKDLIEHNGIENDSTKEASLVTAVAPAVISIEHPDAATEKDSLVDWHDSDMAIGDGYENQENDESNENGIDVDNAAVVPFFLDSSSWDQEWQQSIEYEESDATSPDQRLQSLLQSQLEIPRSLDEQKDYEEALLVWFDENSAVFTLSYQLAKSHFRWDKRLAHWSRNDYPWYRLGSLDERYQHITYFQSPAAFSAFLSRYFPTVASYWSIESSDDTKTNDKEEINKPIEMKRGYIFKRLFFPFWAIGLAQELQALDAELDYYIDDHSSADALVMTNTDSNGDTFTARYWQQESPLKTLNGWVFKRFIEFEDFGLIAIIIAAVLVMLSLFSQKPWQSFYYDGLGVFAAVSLYYLFWQLQLRLFATPNTFVSYEPWSAGWRNASLLFFVLGYVSWLDISNVDSLAMPISPVYFLTHLAGASLFAANSMRQSNLVVTAISWHAGLLLIIVAVLIPLLVVVTGQPPPNDLTGLLISPLFWLLLAAPAFFISLGDAYPRLEWLANVGYKVLAMWRYIIFIGILIIYAYCMDILPEIDFGLTALTIMLITIILSVGRSKFLDTLEES